MPPHLSCKIENGFRITILFLNPFSLFSLQNSIAEFYVCLKLTKPIAVPPLLYLHMEDICPHIFSNRDIWQKMLSPNSILIFNQNSESLRLETANPYGTLEGPLTSKGGTAKTSNGSFCVIDVAHGMTRMSSRHCPQFLTIGNS